MRRAWPALGVLGVVLLVPFEEAWTIALGVLCLLAFVAVGTLVIAGGDFLTQDESET